MMQEELSYWISFICQTCGFDDIASLLPPMTLELQKPFKVTWVSKCFCDDQIRSNVTDKKVIIFKGRNLN